jgi:TldD protein
MVAYPSQEAPVIPKETATRVLSAALRTGGDLAEIYVEDRRSLSLRLEESRLEQAVRGADRGAGVRVFFGDLVTYAYTDDLGEEDLLATAHAAAAAGSGSARSQVIDLARQPSPLQFPVLKPFETVDVAAKAEMLHGMDSTARSFDAHVSQVTASYVELRRQVSIFNSEGLHVEDDRHIVEVRAMVVAQKNGVLQRASGGFGGQMGMELFDTDDPVALGEDLAETAVKMLGARPAPAGEMTVVVNSGWGGVLFHEACGHAMEADFVSKGSSAYTGQVGQRIASPLISAVDDGTIPGRRGSLRFDDDGTPSSRTVLIEDGILQEYMWDLVEARRMKRGSTGNGRRQSFRHMPMPRMTNTYIAAGPHDPEEILRSVERGLYVRRLGGGQADIAKGDFVFSVTEGYLIEDGRMTAPVRGATLMGNGPKVLSEIDMVGTDFALDPGRGMCGKGQGARVSVGQPTVRIPRLTVGGTDKEISGMMGI